MFKNIRGAWFVVVLALALLTAGCASNSTYWNDRKRDALDIVTLTVGVGAGAKAQVGPLNNGLSLIVDRMGLRSGTFGITKPSQGCWDTSGSDLLLLSMDSCYWPGDRRTDAKNYSSGSIFCFPFPPMRNFYANRDALDRSFCSNLPYYTRLEVCGGFIGTLRVGINPGELLDFLLGWTTLDIYQDDEVAIQKMVAEEEAARANIKKENEERDAKQAEREKEKKKEKERQREAEKAAQDARAKQYPMVQGID
ncbi:TPA: hypothetical protein DDW35_02165 [Candidatus Sumerlaeota bacterium]|jgi:hypothetical protein|nr:hypothetical protein [Candidatus Sumerlaeota bacterium]